MNKKLTIGLSVVGIVVIGSAIAFGTLVKLSESSLPGQPLYNFKTNVAEKYIRLTKLSATARVHYDTTLLEQRLQELTTIASDQSTTTPEQIAAIAGRAQDHATDAIATLEKASSLSGESRITLLAKLDTTARAAETLSDSFTELEGISDTVETTEDSLNAALRSSIDTFVTTNATDTIESFIATQITEVSTHISDVAPGSRAQGLVIRRISDTEEALTDNKYADAITAIIRAQQAIAVDGYLFDSERGPVDGVPLEAGPVPEGN